MSYHVWMQLYMLNNLHLLHVLNVYVHMWHFTLHSSHRIMICGRPCAHVLCCPFFFVYSGWDPEHQLRGDGTQFSVSTSPTSYLQALLCVPGQVLRVPLWGQLLWGLQGENNLQDPFELCFVWIYDRLRKTDLDCLFINIRKKDPCRQSVATPVIWVR